MSDGNLEQLALALIRREELRVCIGYETNPVGNFGERLIKNRL